MARCDFCKNVIEKGTGKIYVKKEGKILNFCSNKCEKNLIKLGRNPRTTNWTREFQQVKKGKK
ncbi:50S ribosomal protein L24e [Nanoarchaeota archaeon]